MPFGPKLAPFFFQSCMETIVARKKGLKTKTYYDDLTVHGTLLKLVWEDTLATI